MAEAVKSRITAIDSTLEPYQKDLDLRTQLFESKKKELLNGSGSLADFANGHNYFGIHPTDDGWVYREWAPAAEQMYFTGDFNGWNTRSCPMTKLENGIFEVHIKGKNSLRKGQKVQAIVINGGNELRRIPIYATRVVQDPVT